MFFCFFFQPLLGRLPCLRITPSRFAHKVFALGMCIVLRSRNVCTYEMPCKALTCLPLCVGSMSSAPAAPMPPPASPATPRRRSTRLAASSEEEKIALHDAPTSPVPASERVPVPSLRLHLRQPPGPRFRLRGLPRPHLRAAPQLSASPTSGRRPRPTGRSSAPPTLS